MMRPEFIKLIAENKEFRAIFDRDMLVNVLVHDGCSAEELVVALAEARWQLIRGIQETAKTAIDYVPSSALSGNSR